jgi:hypothetical protein
MSMGLGPSTFFNQKSFFLEFLISVFGIKFYTPFNIGRFALHVYNHLSRKQLSNEVESLYLCQVATKFKY